VRSGRQIWAVEFDRRSTLYAGFDEQLHDHTRFFAAAALVNAALANLFAVWPSFELPRSLIFLSEIGASLEIDNLGYARSISRRVRGAPLDHALVFAEQARLQRHVREHQARCPRQWHHIRRELNGLLNARYSAALFSRWCMASGPLSEVLREAQGPSRLELDFANKSDRVRIGLKLIEHVRKKSAADPARVRYFPHRNQPQERAH
jgi:hypothetical protein